MAGYYDKNKDYSAAIEAAKASGASQETIKQLETERQNKIDAVYGGNEPNMYGSNQTYSQLSGSASSGNSSAQSSIDKAVDFSNSNHNNYFGDDSAYKEAYQAAAGGNWDQVSSLLGGANNGDQYMSDLQNLFGYVAEEPLDYAELLAQLMGSMNPNNYGSSAPQYSGSKWDDVLDTLANQLLSMNYSDWTQGDQYAALASRYGNQGQMSMRDVLGQISSRTGGLASSYATTAAQQQYNNWMADLEKAAMEMYGVERDELLDNAQLAQQYAKDDYNKYLDVLDQWNADRNFNYSVYLDEMNRLADQAEMMAAAGDFSGYKNLGYSDDQVSLLQSATQGSTTASKPTLTAAQTLTALKSGVVNDTTLAAYEYYYGEPYGGTASDTPKKTGGSYDNGSLTTAQVKQLQEMLGVTADGLWGSNSKKAAGGMTADEAWAAYGGGSDMSDVAHLIPDIQSRLMEQGYSASALSAILDNMISKGKITEGQAIKISQHFGWN